jgi:hypothetical protein
MIKVAELEEEMKGRVTARSFMEELDNIKEARMDDKLQRTEVRGFWDELEKKGKASTMADRLAMPDMIRRREMQGRKLHIPASITPTSVTAPKVKGGLGKFMRKLPQTIIKALTRRS